MMMKLGGFSDFSEFYFQDQGQLLLLGTFIIIVIVSLLDGKVKK